MKLKLFVAAFLMLGAAVSQVSTEKVYIWTLNGNKFALTEVTGLVRVGSALTIPVQPTSERIAAGQGIILTRVAGQPTSISVDTPAFYMWVPAPTAPGACQSSVPISDQKILASDAGFLYICAPPVPGGVPRWGRAPLEWTW